MPYRFLNAGAQDEAVRHSTAAANKRNRSLAINQIWDLVGRQCKTQSEIDDVRTKLAALAAVGALSDTELAEAQASITLRADKLTPKVVPPLAGRAKLAVENAKVKTDIDVMTDDEFDVAWRNA